MKLLLFLMLLVSSSASSAGWFTGTITDVGIDFRAGTPESNGQLYIKGSDGNFYNLKWIKNNHDQWWPYIYGLITTAYAQGKTITVEFNDSDNEVRYIVAK